MIMKDKLVKNNHRGIYYKTRRAILGAVISAACLAIIAVPTYISVNNSIKASLAQTDDEDDTENKNNNSGEDENQYQSYSDAE